MWPGECGLVEATAALARTMNIGPWDGDQLVGSVRLLTDGYFLATVSEILVDPAYRRRGIGSELMRRAVAAAPRGRLFFGAQPEAVAFFDRIGCERRLRATDSSNLVTLGPTVVAADSRDRACWARLGWRSVALGLNFEVGWRTTLLASSRKGGL